MFKFVPKTLFKRKLFQDFLCSSMVFAQLSSLQLEFYHPYLFYQYRYLRLISSWRYVEYLVDAILIMV